MVVNNVVVVGSAVVVGSTVVVVSGVVVGCIVVLVCSGVVVSTVVVVITKYYTFIYLRIFTFPLLSGILIIMPYDDICSSDISVREQYF